MYKKIQTVFALLLCLCILFLSACTQDGNASNGQQGEVSKPNVTLPEIDNFEDLLNEDGKINIEYLKSETVSVIKTNFDDRVYIEHNSTPYYYNPVYISYDQILANAYITANRKTDVLEEAFANAKSSGFKTVALFVNWNDFYNGSTYNFDYYKIYYTLAEKYDLKVSIIWNGYAKTGFMPWQTDRTKYPALNTELKVNVPDLSQKIYIDEAVEAITQFCAWLNFIDSDRRTISIQLEDEANTNYGNGIWLSQYVNFSALLEKMADAVKASPYQMVTTVGMTLDDYYIMADDFSGRERFNALFLKESIDGIGVADLTTEGVGINILDNYDKLCYVTKLSPATFDFFEKALNLIKQGFQFGVYELKSFDLIVNCGMYRTHSTNWQYRDCQLVDRGILAKKRVLEAATADVADFIKGINSIGELMAVNSTVDISLLNSMVANSFISEIEIGDTSVTFNNANNPKYTYNSAGICVVDPYSNYYIFSFRGTPTVTVNYDSEFKYTQGVYESGKWVASGEEVTAQNNSFVLKSGVVYKFGFED